MVEVQFEDYFNEGNITGLGYGYVGCFFMWLFGTSDDNAISNIMAAAARREQNGPIYKRKGKNMSKGERCFIYFLLWSFLMMYFCSGSGPRPRVERSQEAQRPYVERGFNGECACGD